MDLKTVLKAIWCYFWHSRKNVLGQTRCDTEGCPFKVTTTEPPLTIREIHVVPGNTVLAPIVCPKCGNDFKDQARYALVSTEDPSQPFLNSAGEIIAGFGREEVELYAQTLNRQTLKPVAKAMELDVPTWVIIHERAPDAFEVVRQPNSETARQQFDALRAMHRPVYLCRIEQGPTEEGRRNAR